MKIMHIAPLSPYNVGWSYQDNLLPKYQRKMGHEVVVVVSPFENTSNGKVDVGETDFILDDGVHVYRRRRMFGNSPFGKAVSFTDVGDILKSFQPDFVMIHSLMTLTVFQVIHYKKKYNPQCVIIHDNHLDENIGRRKTKLLTDLFYKYWRFVNGFSKKYVAKYYGVTPWRQDFIVKRFGIEREKTDVLIMGADDELIDFDNRNQIRNDLRNQYNIGTDFVICTGGKIEKNKKIDLLMKAVKGMPGVKLLVFGNVADNYKGEIEKSINENVIMLGWMNTKEINDVFLASDIAVFPGQHSVLWEQACACKIPCLFAYWDGMNHLNIGGNCAFICADSVEAIRNSIMKYANTDIYEALREKADSPLTDVFLYKNIADKSLEAASQKMQ